MSLENPQKMIPSEERKMEGIRIVDPVNESFEGLTKGLEDRTEIPVDAVANERARQEEIKAQREKDKLELQALRMKLKMETGEEDTIPLAA